MGKGLDDGDQLVAALAEGGRGGGGKEEESIEKLCNSSLGRAGTAEVLLFDLNS